MMQTKWNMVAYFFLKKDFDPKDPKMSFWNELLFGIFWGTCFFLKRKKLFANNRTQGSNTSKPKENKITK